MMMLLITTMLTMYLIDAYLSIKWKKDQVWSKWLIGTVTILLVIKYYLDTNLYIKYGL